MHAPSPAWHQVRASLPAGLLILLLLMLAACMDAPSADTPTAIPVASPTAAPATMRPATPAPTAVLPTATVPAATATALLPTATLAAPTSIAGSTGLVPILAYHHFGVPDAGDYDCGLADFEQHLQWLHQNGYESVLPQQMVDALHGKATLPPRPVMITFDDNNAEQYTDAAPLLEQYGYRGAFFVMTVTIGKRYYMDAEQLQDLERRGHVIGNHTWDHRDMAILTPAERQEQLDKSEQDLVEVLGHRPEFFSYPFGGYDEDVAAELQARGYKAGFRLRAADDPIVDPAFMIHRAIVPGLWSIEEFAQNIHYMEP
ncbi:MAG TPA: polysaccharide deacetylase family protein [Chloroflexia bacterium]|nr:polysaccharide deacetylase family protein [Chloroflexia bacterium]